MYMLRKICFALFVLILNTAHAQCVSIQSDRTNSAVKWMNTHFAKGKIPPFSFCYDGKPSKSFINRWKYVVHELQTTEEGAVKRCYTYQDPETGLKVECEVTAYTDFEALEWVLHFIQTGQKNSGTISEVRETDIDFRFPVSGPFALHYANGSFPSRADFAPQDREFQPGDSLLLHNAGGRSSQLVMPFFNIESPSSKQGVIATIGWTGSWTALMHTPSNREFCLKTGLANLDSYLMPQEEIRTASVCLLFWQSSDRFVGNNQLRRFILAHHTRKIDNRAAIYPYYFGFSWGDPAPCNEYSCLTNKMALALLERQEMFGLTAEASWLDAGWYEDADNYENGKNWANTVGNWVVNKAHFPNGLREIGDQLHRMGRKFMVWFEPERVVEGTRWAKEHPEWMLRMPGNDNLLYNLGNPEANEWLCKYIGDFLEENHIDYYRQDFNICPDAYWAQYDEKDRKGMTEIRYITGLYRYWDYLLNRFPNLLIDNCASGGNRLDWETTLRSAPLWRTDDCYYNDPSDMQCHTYGINLFLPQSGTGMGLPDRADKYSLRSSMGSSMIFNWKILTHNESFMAMRECQKEYLMVRPYFLEDYYPLTGTTKTNAYDNWLAYQLDRPADHTGLIAAFRHHENKETEITVQLHGLDADVTYRLVNQDDQTEQTLSGKELMDGLKLSLTSVDSSLLLRYERVVTH